LLSAAGFAVYSIQPQRLMGKYGTLIITGWGMVIGGIVLTVIFRPWTYKVSYDSGLIISFVVIVIFGTIMAYVFYLEGIKRVGAAVGSLLSSVEPVAATLLAVLWLGETFAAIDLIGFTFIFMIPIILSSRANKK